MRRYVQQVFVIYNRIGERKKKPKETVRLKNIERASLVVIGLDLIRGKAFRTSLTPNFKRVSIIYIYKKKRNTTNNTHVRYVFACVIFLLFCICWFPERPRVEY